jgi:hypothetical protein
MVDMPLAGALGCAPAGCGAASAAGVVIRRLSRCLYRGVAQADWFTHPLWLLEHFLCSALQISVLPFLMHRDEVAVGAVGSSLWRAPTLFGSNRVVGSSARDIYGVRGPAGCGLP